MTDAQTVTGKITLEDVTVVTRNNGSSLSNALQAILTLAYLYYATNPDALEDHREWLSDKAHDAAQWLQDKMGMFRTWRAIRIHPETGE